MTQQKIITPLSPKKHAQTRNTAQQRPPHSGIRIRKQRNHMVLELRQEFLAASVVEHVDACFGERGLGLLVRVGQGAVGPERLGYVLKAGGGGGEVGDAGGVGGADEGVFVGGEFV